MKGLDLSPQEIAEAERRYGELLAKHPGETQSLRSLFGCLLGYAGAAAGLLHGRTALLKIPCRVSLLQVPWCHGSGTPHAQLTSSCCCCWSTA